MAGIAGRVPREIKQGRLQIPVIGASEIPRIQYSSGAAQALQAFSRDMFSLANGFQDQLDQTVEAEGEVQGALAGATGDFEPQSYGTIRGRAFNKAAIETFVTTVETRSIFKVQELQAKFGADPARLQAELENYRAGVAGEVGKIYPPAAAAFSQRLALRSAPAVEAARDARYKLTREAADAALIENEVALKAEISTLAGDLFSENPARSEAATQAVGALQQEFLQIYEAVDPTTGRPLYNAEEKAKAKVGFYEDVMENAAIGWFDQQPDKAGAYVRFTEGDFTINLQSAPTVKLPEAVGSIIDAAAARHGVPADALRTVAWIESKGDPAADNPKSTAGGLFQFINSTAKRYGLKNKYDAYESSDAGARLMADNMNALRGILGREPNTGELYLAHQQGLGGAQSLLSNPGELAVNVVGYDEVRLNGGSPGMTAGEFAGLWTKKANKINRTGEKQSIDVRKALPAAAMDRIETEMRARISFGNTMVDRAVAAEEKEVKRGQEAIEFEMYNRIWAHGNDPETGQPREPLNREQIENAVRKGFVAPEAGKGMIKALTVDKPERSDPAFYGDVLRRLYAGENVYSYILDNADKLSGKDASELLGKNQTMNVAGEGSMTKEQTFYEGQLKDLLTPDSAMAQYDEGKENRKFLALQEFRDRIAEGEPARDVVADVSARATLDFGVLDQSKLGAMVRPRFSVKVEGQNRIDVAASGRALVKAFRSNQIEADEFERQKIALKRWEAVQLSLEAAERAAAATKGK
jgi:hypothetical protein